MAFWSRTKRIGNFRQETSRSDGSLGEVFADWLELESEALASVGSGKDFDEMS